MNLRSLFRARYPVYVFHHIPKCGGTAVRDALSQWFKVVPDYLTVLQLKGWEEVAPPVKLHRLNNRHCLSGHFESEYNHLELRYPEILNNPHQYPLFTFLRDPLKLRVSLYYYEIEAGRRKKNAQSLEAYLLSANNYIARRFRCDEDSYKRILDRYFFIGLQEELQTSMDQLAEVLQKPKVALRMINQSPRDEQSKEIDHSVLQTFKRNNALDYSLYQYAADQNNRMI